MDNSEQTFENRPEWTYDIDRTIYVDEIFSVIGRLLYRACRFEGYCKSLCILLEFYDDPKNITSSVYREKLLKRKNLGIWIEILGKNPSIDNELVGILKTVKEVRNKIAHELTLGLEGVFENIERENMLENEIKTLSRNIITGEFLVISILSNLTNEQTPEINYIEKKHWLDFEQRIIRRTI